ncbi:unnamed protein product [Amoebophrya sp. A25]|nr:unnamed protein product [Amoebophrya sp. A25]|eukprot:GSA25T00004023001.1
MLRKLRGNKTTNWSGGSTKELFLLGEDFKTRKFDLRISCAKIATPESDFTPLNGFSRNLTLLHAWPQHDLRLFVNGTEHILRPWQSFEFLGSDVVKSLGKAEDFNVIYDANKVTDVRVEAFTVTSGRMKNIRPSISSASSSSINTTGGGTSPPWVRTSFVHWPDIQMVGVRVQQGQEERKKKKQETFIHVVSPTTKLEMRPGESFMLDSSDLDKVQIETASSTPDDRSFEQDGDHVRWILVEFTAPIKSISTSQSHSKM